MTYRILLVEDENLIRVTLAEMLGEAGYDVVEAATGDECVYVDPRRRERFRCALDGYSNARLGRTASMSPTTSMPIMPNAPVVFMTGRPDMLSRIGRLTESEALLRKPFRPRQMLDALDGLLTRHV